MIEIAGDRLARSLLNPFTGPGRRLPEAIHIRNRRHRRFHCEADKKIMMAFDQSGYSYPSLQYASDFAAGIGAALLVVNVVNQRDIRTTEDLLETYNPALCQRYIEECMTDYKS